MRHIISAMCAVLSVFSFSAITPAATLEIQFDGFNFVYDANVSGGAIFDATSSSGGTGDPGQADPLDTMNFKVDGALVGSLNTNIFADLSISVSALFQLARASTSVVVFPLVVEHSIS
jgi:hypothetical protein